MGEILAPLNKDTLKKEELLLNGQYPVVNSGREYYGFYNSCNVEQESITIAARGEYAGFVRYEPEPFWAGGLCYPYSAKDTKSTHLKYVYYYLKNDEKRIMKKLVSRGSIPALNKKDFEKYKILLPNFSIQKEITRLLDSFDHYVNDISGMLPAEIKSRKQQYEYYRDKLLDLPRKAV